MSRALGIAAAGLTAAAAVVWWGWRKQSVAPAAATRAPAPAVPAVEPPVAPAVAPVAPPTAPPPSAPLGVGFPDGSTAPSLNGVKERVQLVWNDRPFSPIKTKITSAGVEWYVHEDGSHSTVQYIEVNGVPQAVGLVCSPTDVLPTSVDLQWQMQQQGQRPGR